MKLYNTLTRSLDEITLQDDTKLKIYTCGLTVYSQPHIGNWVGYIYWDVLIRALQQEGYAVKRTQNYTDVGHLVSDDDSGEDKMEKGAKREGITAWDVAEKYITIADHEAFEQLDLLRPDHLVRATEYIPQQIVFASKLEEKGYLYKIDGDGMYFDTSKINNYGHLARLDIAGLEAGARVSVVGKKNITDFAVWKFSPTNQTRDMEWDSPWGKGFPGWHLECSVIAQETLGDSIDIHTGGVDHVPVHHTNEIAQTEAVTGTQFSKFWVHNNHLKVDGGKMAKSLGNIYTLSDITSRGYSIDAFKLFVLSKHYRSEGNFTWDNMDMAQKRLDSLERMADLQFQAKPVDNWVQDDKTIVQIADALQNDLNTSVATTAMLRFASQAEDNLVSDHDQANFVDHLQFFDKIFGLHLLARTDISNEQRQMIADREAARQSKDFSLSDNIRDNLLEQGITVRDTPHGAIWFRVRQ